MKKIIFTIMALILITGLVFAEDYVTLKTDNYNVNIESPLSMNLLSDYKVNPESIKIRTSDSISIIGGQSIISKYDFTNKLDYSVIGRYELNTGITDKEQLKKIGIYVADALPEIDCVSESGEILVYNAKRISITNNKAEETDKEQLYLCYVLKTTGYTFDSGKLILDMELKSGVNEKYILFVTTPTLSLENSNLKFQDSIKIKETNELQEIPVTTANTENSKDLKDIDSYNKQITYTKANTNYNTVDVVTGEKTINSQDNKTQNNLSEKASTLKSKATALLTFTPKNLMIIGAGILAIIVLAIIIYNRKNKDLSDVH
jgi:hypothetical protein